MKTRSPELALGHQKTVDVPQNCELYLALDESKDSQKAPGEPFQLFPYFPHIKPSSPPRQMHNLLILVLLHLFPSRPKQKCTFPYSSLLHSYPCFISISTANHLRSTQVPAGLLQALLSVLLKYQFF